MYGGSNHKVESGKRFKLGILHRREHPPETLPDFARRAEEAGFDELWVVEDCFYGSGIASAATALASTGFITVGVGIMPAVVRNPVFTAMEIATLARLHPGRFLPGIGHGVAGWMRQIGAFPQSQLKALEEVTITVKRILAGENVSFDGSEVQLDQAELVHPPEQVPPVSLGVRGPKSLMLSGRVADGTILPEFAGPEYIAWAREQIEAGQQEAGRDEAHYLTVFTFVCVDAAAARQHVRPLVAASLSKSRRHAQIVPMGILPQVHELLEAGSVQRLEEEMPDDWIDRLTVVGTPDECRQSIHRLVEAGADSVVLVPLPDRGLDELEVFARYFVRN
jgi:5,10-methylenetetrahydromethanopterin reductase